MSLLKKRYIILLAICLVIVCLPRLNQNDFGFIKNFIGKGDIHHEYIADGQAVSFDVYQYITYVKYFREQRTVDSLEAPFSYRPVVPWLASFLPMNPMMAINFVNILSLMVGLLYLIRILLELGFNTRLQFAGGLFYVFSFPVFYNGAIGCIDPLPICLIIVGIFYLLKKNYWLLSLAILIGIFTKESIILILPFIYGLVTMNRNNIKSRLQTGFLLFILFVIILVLPRFISPSHKSYVWAPSFNLMVENLSRVKTYLSFLLSFGYLGILALIVCWNNRPGSQAQIIGLSPFIFGFIGALAFYGYSLISAYSDGRFIWMSYPFSIPLSLYYLQSKDFKIFRIRKNPLP
jgi:hypothetical protein